MIQCYGREGKGPQLVVMVAGIPSPNNKGSAACRREPKEARLISAQQWAWMSAHTMAGAFECSSLTARARALACVTFHFQAVFLLTHKG